MFEIQDTVVVSVFLWCFGFLVWGLFFFNHRVIE